MHLHYLGVLLIYRLHPRERVHVLEHSFIYCCLVGVVSYERLRAYIGALMLHALRWAFGVRLKGRRLVVADNSLMVVDSSLVLIARVDVDAVLIAEAEDDSLNDTGHVFHLG